MTTAPPEVDLDAARAHLAEAHPHLRTMALWSTSWDGDEPSRADAVALYEHGEPVERLFADTAYHRWYREGERQFPRILHARRRDPASLALSASGHALTVESLCSWLFVLPSGTLVAGLTVDYRLRLDGSLPPIPELYRDLDRDRDGLQISGEALLAACCPDAVTRIGTLRLGGDFHGITMLPSAGLRLGMKTDRHLLQRLVSRAAEPSRDEHLTVRCPPEANRYLHMAAGITPGAMALIGHEPVIEASAAVCVVQALAAISGLRVIQRRGFHSLSSLRSAVAADPDWLARRRLELRELELELSFSIEAYLDIRLLVPSLPIEEINRALADALCLERGAAVAGTMLARLGSAIQAEAEALAARERVAAHARRTAAAAAAGVAGIVALPLAFLGVNSREVSASRSMFDVGHYWPEYAVLVGVVVLTALAALLYVRRSERQGLAAEA